MVFSEEEIRMCVETGSRQVSLGTSHQSRLSLLTYCLKFIVASWCCLLEEKLIFRA